MKIHKRSTGIRMVVLAGVILPTLWAIESRAATFTVNSNADNGANCTLRLAVAAANGGTNACGHGTANGDIVQLGGPNATSVTLSAANGPIAVTSNMTIQGNFNNQHQNFTDAVVTAATGGHIFEGQSGTLTVNYLRLTGAGDLDANGGAIAVFSGASGTLNTVQIDHCTAWLGGGLYAGGTLTITNSSLHDNHAANGGAIFADVVFGATNTSFSNNVADQNPGNGFGGAVYTGNGALIQGCTFFSNTADQGGGYMHSGSGLNEIYHSTFEANRATWAGGAFNGEGIQVVNSTFFKNSSGGGGGGGIFLRAMMPLSGGYFFIEACTITGNSTTGLGGGIYAESDEAVPDIFFNIIANNTAPYSTGEMFSYFYSNPEFTGSGNLFQNGTQVVPDITCATQGCTNPSNCPNPICKDPLLGTYGSFNGLPKSFPLRPGSPAIDMAGYPTNYDGWQDARLFPRPLDGNGDGNAYYDWGAVEYDPWQTEALTVAAKSSDNHTIVTDTTYSNGQGTWLHSDAANDFVTYAVAVPTAGTYAVSFRAQRGTDRGIARLATATTLNGTYTNLGNPQDFYSSGTNFVVPSLGNVTFLSGGTKYVRFALTGKNSASSGFNIRLDYLLLVKQ